MATTNHVELMTGIRTVADFPEPGIQFKDITPLLADPNLLKIAMDELHAPFRHYDNIDKVLGIEARGFILGAMLAERLHAGFVPVRKANKLPAETVSASYDLEYGSATIEMHADAIKPGERVIIHDDVIATGGTAKAAAQLVEERGGNVVAFSFLIELKFLDGRQKIPGTPIFAVLTL